jgi:hypothetical protein
LIIETLGNLKGLEEPKHDSRVSRQVRKFFFPSSNIIRRMKGIAREITNNARDKERKRERERERENDRVINLHHKLKEDRPF